MRAIGRNQRVGIVALVVALLVGLTLSSGTAGAGVLGQTKTLLTDTNRDCGGNFIVAPTGTFGSATMNQSKAPKNGSSNLSAGLIVQGAARGATYDIRLIQVDSSGHAVGDSCHTVVGTVTLDAFGSGTATAAARVLPGATQWWVVLNNQASFVDFVDTDLAPIA
jgi:hypothetical protein